MLYNSVFKINLNRIKENVQRIKSSLATQTQIIPMLKGDAYGHGLVEIASLLSAYEEIEFLGVAQVSEAIQLIQNDIQKRIILFAGVTDAQLNHILDYHIEPMLHSFASFKALDEKLKERGLKHYPVHLKINTGLNRLGFTLDELNDLIALLKDNERIEIISTYSHFTEGYKVNSEVSLNQFDIFNKALDMLKENKISYGFRHICDSGAYEWLPEAHLDAVRIGRALYMDNPDKASELRFKDAGSWLASLIEVKKIPIGHSIGYNTDCTFEEEKIIGIVNVGYADGLFLDLVKLQAPVLINNQKTRFISIAMDQSFVDLTHIKAKRMDTVVLFGEDDSHHYMSSHEIAQLFDDEGCTLTTLLSKRVKKEYLD